MRLLVLFLMSHPGKLRWVRDSTRHVLQAEQANPTKAMLRMIIL